MRSLFGCFDIDDDGALNQAEYRCFLRTCGQYTNGEWSSGLITDTEWQAQWPQELERFKNEGEGHVHRDAFVKYYDRDLDADEGMVVQSSCISLSHCVSIFFKKKMLL